MPDWKGLNQQKITKAVYLLLEQYHRIYGLGVVGWSKSPGNIYFSLFSFGALDEDGNPKHLVDTSGRMSLTIYQDHLGLPAWGAGKQQYHEHQEERELTTGEIIAWLKARLNLDELFSENDGQISMWRKSYHVSESEAFLLTWNVLGHYSAKTGHRISTYGRSEYYSGIPDSEKALVARLGCRNPTESVHFCGDLAFSNHGKVLTSNGEVIDLFKEHLNGVSSQEIAARLIGLSHRA